MTGTRVPGLLVALWIAGAACGRASETTMNDDEATVPAISVATEPRYLIGFPMLAEVTLHNDTRETVFLDLPDLGLLLPLDSVGLELRPEDGGEPLTIPPSFHYTEMNLYRTKLEPGDSRTALLDLTDFGAAFPTGRYRLRLSLFQGAGDSRVSEDVAVELAEPTSDEAAEARRLRRLALGPDATDTGAWQPFLTDNWNAVELETRLGSDARDALALYLFLQRALYGPEAVAGTDPAPLAKVPDIARGEAEALTYEILAARGEKQDARRRAVASRWPGLLHRLAEADRGEGWLAAARKQVGAEKEFLREAPPNPYR